MVARVGGPAPPESGAVVRAPGPAAAFKTRWVNVKESRMREIRLYGLMRGRWPVRARTAGWGLLHRRGRRGRSSDPDPAPPELDPDPASSPDRPRAGEVGRGP